MFSSNVACLSYWLTKSCKENHIINGFKLLFPQHKLLHIGAETHGEMNASQNKQYKIDCAPFSPRPLFKTNTSPLKLEAQVLTKTWCRLVFSTLNLRVQLSQELPVDLPRAEIPLQSVPLLLVAIGMEVCKARLQFLDPSEKWWSHESNKSIFIFIF